MKKYIRKLVLVIIILFTCACAKDETIMTINSDKSVNLEINIGYSIDSGKEIDVIKLKDNVSPLGYNVDSYHDDKFSGYRLTKKFNSINDISTTENIEINFADLINGTLDDSKLFKVEKGFFKNTYTAKYNYDFRNYYDYKIKIYIFGEESNDQTNNVVSYLNELISENNYNIELKKYNILSNRDDFNYMNEILNKLGKQFSGIPFILLGNTIYGSDEESKNLIKENLEQIYNNNVYYEDIVANDFDRNYELTYKVNLPNKYIKTNANEIVNDGKTLIWNQGYYNPQSIEFSFSLFNKSSIIIILLIIIFLIFGIIISYILYIKYKKDREKFVAKNTNISNITPKIDNNNQITSINDLIQK